MNNHISWHVELQVKPGQLETLRALTTEMVDSAKSEPGTLIYERFLSEDGQIVHGFERYLDSAAALTHLAAFDARYRERFARLVERKQFTVFGTPSLELRQMLDRFEATYSPGLAGFVRMQSSGGN